MSTEPLSASEGAPRPERALKTLVVTPFLPYPLVFGAAIRLYNKLRMLGTFSDVSLLSYQSWTDEDPAAHLATLCREVVVLDAKPPDSKVERVRSLASLHSYQHRAHRSAAMQRAIDEMVAAERYDILMVDLTPMGQFRLPDGPLRVLDLHNIEHELVERRATTARTKLRRAMLGLEARKLRREELEFCRRFDLLLTTSDRETEILRSWGMPRVETVVNTIDAQAFTPPPGPRDVGPRLAFIGTTHVDANRDGVRYFMDEIFPMVREKVPEVEVDIVGGNPPAEIRAYDALPGVRVTGQVKDVRDYMATARVLIVPLRSGGGTRLKILEGLSFGVPTVSTSIGAEGLDLVPGEHLLIADEPRSFADSVLRLLDDETLRVRLRSAGRQYVEEHYDWRMVQDRLRTVIESTLAERALPTSS
jgi:glycosyltransferase involved in cell wall biosynthesis